MVKSFDRDDVVEIADGEELVNFWLVMKVDMRILSLYH
jgi:hypothetical protein